MTFSYPSDVDTAAEPRQKRPKGMKGFVYDYITDRIERLNNRENVEQILTSDVWYDLVDETKDSKWGGVLAKYFRGKYNLNIKGPEAAKRRTRETIISYIKDVCDELQIRRADVNILAGDVGYLFFRDKRYPISLDELDKLRLKGTDVLIIEKQGIAEVLNDFAAPLGVALLSTRGFLTENALDLSAFAESSGANVAILTDCDISGYVIAHKVPDVPRIGIDFDTLEDLGISDDLGNGEYYTPDQGHLKYAEENIEDFDLEELDFLRTRRIEINAVKNKVGPNELWNWILGKLEEIYPNRNYNRAINIPKPYRFRPTELDQVNALIDTRIGNILQPEIKICQRELSDYPGFIDDVSDYEEELHDEFEYVLNGGGSSGGASGGVNNGSSSDVSTSTQQSTTKNFLKNITNDLAKLVKKYGDGGVGG